MFKNVKLPELTGDVQRDIAVLWEFLYKNTEKQSTQVNAVRTGCKRETIKFASGKGRMVCEGIVPASAVTATCSSIGKDFAVQAAYCDEAGSAVIILTESYSGIADISVFWSKEANGNV